MQTVELRKSDLPLIFALVREDFSEVGLLPWLTYASSYVDVDPDPHARGIVAAHTGLRRYRGLFFYSVETTLQHGRTLVLPHLIVPEVPDRAVVLETLIDKAYEIATDKRCHGLQAYFHPQTAADLLPLFRLEAEVSSLCLSAPLPQKRSGTRP